MSSACSRSISAVSLVLAAFLAQPASAQGDKKEPEKPAAEKPAEKAAKVERPVTDDTVTMGDAATSPLNDFNLSRDKIPDILVEARKNPYARSKHMRCPEIAAAVGEMDAVLGEDLDIAERQGRKTGAGDIAKWAVGSFIPFRGLVRELSGARRHEQEFRDAIVAGMMRRAYLKGLGEQKNCRYPARPATPEVLKVIAERDELAAKTMAQDAKAKDKPAETRQAEEKKPEDTKAPEKK